MIHSGNRVIKVTRDLALLLNSFECHESIKRALYFSKIPKKTLAGTNHFGHACSWRPSVGRSKFSCSAVYLHHILKKNQWNY